MFKEKLSLEGIGPLVTIALCLLSVFIFSRYQNNEYEKHYIHAKEIYVNQLMDSDKSITEEEALIKAEDKLSIFKGKKSIVDIDENLIVLSSIIRTDNSIKEEALIKILNENND